ncbi:hypothetical protein CASFOL_029533 [Castilleja foliolosa]|uniref:Uncharacterized protein n=1 Tax=Castilleja foliolosa TaxID=1961234 RepID=A0ABD3C9C3_9LAMI
MDISNIGSGLMAVFAVSGSVVFLAMQAHKRLLSNFMNKMEFEFNNPTGEGKKKVRFADDVMADQKEGPTTYISKQTNSISKRNYGENLEAMPQNWQIMYKGILQYRNLRGYN